jgi:hypothetical protein
MPCCLAAVGRSKGGCWQLRFLPYRWCPPPAARAADPPPVHVLPGGVGNLATFFPQGAVPALLAERGCWLAADAAAATHGAYPVPVGPTPSGASGLKTRTASSPAVTLSGEQPGRASPRTWAGGPRTRQARGGDQNAATRCEGGVPRFAPEIAIASSGRQTDSTEPRVHPHFGIFCVTVGEMEGRQTWLVLPT